MVFPEGSRGNSKVCSSVVEYFVSNNFDSKTLVNYFNTEKKEGSLSKHVKKIKFKKKKSQSTVYTESTLNEQLNNVYSKKAKCRQQINDYNALNHMLNNEDSAPTTLNCDVIKPPLKHCIGKGKCKSFGKYLVQFGPRVYANFVKLKTRLEKIGKKGKKGKKEKKSSNGKLATKLKQLNAKMKRVKKFGKRGILVMIPFIDSYYKLNCKSLIADYNLFNDYYVKTYNEEAAEKHKPVCDYFVRLKSQNVIAHND